MPHSVENAIERSRRQESVLFQDHAKANQAETDQKRGYSNGPDVGR
jgi:hypothetical protein